MGKQVRGVDKGKGTKKFENGLLKKVNNLR